ncbi:class I SAM-dependent methyltransferase [Flavitalea sp.]|nr:class I SAM-dependent methyltransferase [Flavitalea sp.]
MKQQLISVLKKLGIYHSLQLTYRSTIFQLIKISNRVRYASQKGTGYTCNFCHKQYQSFVPDIPGTVIANVIKKYNVVAGYGDNVFCPNCMSKNRERLLLCILKDRIDIRGKKILQFSPEKNLFEYLKKEAEVTTVDTMPGYYTNIDSQIAFADATCLPFQDATFDIVMANHILEHIPQDIKAIREIYRVLKPRAVAILQVPFSASISTTIEDPAINDPVKQEELFGQKDHVRVYALNDYLRRIESAGFQNEALSPSHLKQYQNFAIQKEEYVFLCHKR